MTLTTRFFIYAPFALFVALVLGLTIRWFSEARSFSKRLDALNGREMMPGVTLHFSSKRIEGFPFRLDAVFENLQIDVRTPHGSSYWRSDDFALHRLTYGADTTIFEAAGRQHIGWTSLDGRRHELSFAIGSLHASAMEDASGLARFDLESVSLASAAVNANDLQLHARYDAGADIVDIAILGDGLKLGRSLRSPLGDGIDHFLISGKAGPGAALASARAGRIDWRAALANLKQANGAVHFDQIEIAWARLVASGKGTLSLDDSSRPQGLLDIKIARYRRFLDAVRTADRRKGLATAILDRAAKAGADDMGRLGIVVGAKDGIVYAGDEPIGELSPVY